MNKLDNDLNILKRRVEREKQARQSAERLLELKSLELYNSNKSLQKSNLNLDAIVSERTQDLKKITFKATQTAIDLQASLDRIKLVINAANAIILDWIILDDTFTCSSKIEIELGYPLEFITNYQKFLNIIHSDERRAVKSLVTEHLETGESFNIDCRLLHKNGKYLWFHIIGQVVRDDNAIPTRLVGSLTNINSRIENAKTIKKMAEIDTLTGISNRRYFNEYIEKLLLKHNKTPLLFSIFIIDLNDFKLINDRYGHEIGDKTLNYISNLLRTQISNEDFLARLGGDEFALIIQNQNSLNDLNLFCEQLKTNADKYLEIEGFSFSANLSIGIAQFPQDGVSVERLLRCADIAMYSAKRLKVSGSHFEIYSAELERDSNRRSHLRLEIEAALKESEFCLAFQPCFDLKNQSFESCEALLRWPSMNPELCIQDVISVAEDSGLILQIGEWVIEEACKFIAELSHSGIENKVTVNLSAIQFQYQDIVSIIKNAANKNKIDPSLLHIEVTENLFLDNMEKATYTLEALHELGMEIYIDDFGTGYSSLKYLQILPVDWVKIDKTFIDGLGKGENSLQIVKAIVAMSHSMNLKVVAEGVENIDQFELLSQIDCDVIQGYYKSKPLSKQEYINFIIESQTEFELLVSV